MKKQKNYLDFKPSRAEHLAWTQDEQGKVTLQKPNKGAVNRIFQIIFRKPKISYIHLDDMGSFIWPRLDGEKTVMQLGEEVKEHFGEKAEPLYPRLVKYIQILESYNFITIN